MTSEKVGFARAARNALRVLRQLVNVVPRFATVLLHLMAAECKTCATLCFSSVMPDLMLLDLSVK